MRNIFKEIRQKSFNVINYFADRMDHVKGKKYEQIAAREIDGHVKFFEDIQDPTYLTE